MAPKKKTEEAVEAAPEAMSEAKMNFLQMIALYKIQNPTKYAQKEAAFLKKLSKL